MDTSETTQRIDPGQFRQALGSYATGVTVVSAAAHGNKAGVTANSFTSVSLDPPLILWCLATSSDSLPVFQAATHFAVNILASDQVELSNHFSRGQQDKFSSVICDIGKGGAPLLSGCATWLQCRTANQVEAGDHWIFIGEVEEITATGKETLLYHQGGYAMSLPHPETDPEEPVMVRKSDPYDEGLYTLLVQAIHAYQEKFESKQHKLTDNKYEARILTLLRGRERQDSTELSRQIQVPKSEMTSLLANLQAQGLIRTDSPDSAALTAAGTTLADQLWEIAKEHERDALSSFSNSAALTFKQNLRKLIHWGQQ